MVRLAFFVRDRRDRVRGYEQAMGRVPSEMHYGLPVLQQLDGFSVTPWFVGRGSTAAPAYFARRAYRRFCTPERVLWTYVSRMLSLRILAAQHRWDVAVSADTVASITLLSLKRSGTLRTPVVCMLLAVADWLERASAEDRRRSLDVLSCADRILVLGLGELNYLRSVGLHQSEYLPFGVDTDFWQPGSRPLKDFVLAVGSDPNRDFDTLVRASDRPVKIVTGQPQLVTQPLPTHAALVTSWYADLLRLFAEARVTAVPLRNSLQPSGQHTIMQAMSMGKALILTDTRGRWTDVLRHDENCLLVPPGDIAAMRAAIERTFEPGVAERLGLAARATALQYFDTRYLAASWASAARECAVVPVG